ncbi:MAG TPA: hypothetical protein PLC90_10000 [Bacteroidales bacterium]|jgi:hypothetical protein|nr:hypothetical protein [Bacteroidales bacterium]
MSFWDSQLIKDLEKGKLPQVPVTIEAKSIVILSLAILAVGIILMLSYRIFKK